jgi:hypothetical protein
VASAQPKPLEMVWDGDGFAGTVGVVHQGAEITATITNMSQGFVSGDRQNSASHQNKFCNPFHPFPLSSRTSRENWSKSSDQRVKSQMEANA